MGLEVTEKGSRLFFQPLNLGNVFISVRGPKEAIKVADSEGKGEVTIELGPEGASGLEVDISGASYEAGAEPEKAKRGRRKGAGRKKGAAKKATRKVASTTRKSSAPRVTSAPTEPEPEPEPVLGAPATSAPS